MNNVHQDSEASNHKDYQFLRLFLPLNWLIIVRIRICGPFHTDLEKHTRINMLAWGQGKIENLWCEKLATHRNISKKYC